VRFPKQKRVDEDEVFRRLRVTNNSEIAQLISSFSLASSAKIKIKMRRVSRNLIRAKLIA
jgi:hypothetical protein